ncbi:MAG: glutathione peroxidase [Winogradskyella sp.]|uniref:glutathione peroxidase n=1 Tax=Winogradskyella sp. TaxID=1883156 RepID=UPI00180B306B|nr:glutathione peroxidase [Winogradskyella sp.]
MNPLKSFFNTLKTTNEPSNTNIPSSIYDVEINALNGQPLDLKQFKGKKLLVVNVASKCGFTPQYKELQQLQDQYKDKLAIIGVPSNQFGSQEPGSSDDIQQFCELNYGVTFPITEKIKVKGSQQHPLYQWLTQKAFNGKKNSSVKWNFQKYLVNENGELIDYYFSMTSPLSSKLVNHLN